MREGKKLRRGRVQVVVLLACIWGCDSSHSSGTPIPHLIGSSDDEGGVSAPPTLGTSANWTKVADSPGYLTAIWGTGSNDGWAVGSNNNAIRWDGATWSLVLSGTSGALYGVWGSAANDVWAVGGSGDSYGYGKILRWDGAAWSVSVNQSSCEFHGVWGSSSSDVWAVGVSRSKSCLYHWDGSTWAEHAGFSTLPLTAVWGSSSDDVWAVGGNVSSNGVIAHWDGSAWTTVAQGSELLALYGLAAVWGSSSSDVWAVGLQNVAHWNGQSWSIEQCVDYAHSLPVGDTQSPCPRGSLAIWGASASDVWVVGGDIVAGFARHWDGTAWTLTDNDLDRAVRGIWGSGSKDLWAVEDGAGTGGVILHHNQ